MLKYIIVNITINNIPDTLLKNRREEFIDRFLNETIKLVDCFWEEEKNQVILTLLSNKTQIMGLILKVLKTEFFNPKSLKDKKELPIIKSLSFYPLRMEKIDELNHYINEHLPQISKISPKGIVPLGYLVSTDHPPIISYYKNIKNDDFMKKLQQDDSFISHGVKFVKNKEDIIYITTKPYPVVFYLKIAMDEVNVIEKICKKLKKFGKVNIIGSDNENKNEEYSLLNTAHTYSVPNDTATIAVKINDYLKIPFHKVMIYIYDILDKNDCIPFEAEFGFPIPSEVIKIASEDLFYDKESPAELSKEIEKVLTLFRFDIDNIFGYPSMLLEKKYNITDI